MNFEAILFDCDGVLVDSEPITNRVLARRLAALGWEMSVEECMAIFVGKAVKDEVDQIAARTGVRVDDGWLVAFRAERDAALATEIQAIPGTLTAIPALHAAWGGRIACASGADRKKVDLMLQRVGLWPCFEGRIFSGHEMPRSKPAPDVYLAAAAALGADPRRCLVIEDTPTGVTAGVAAGALVWGYSPRGAGGHGSPHSLRAAGAAEVFTHMGDLPALLGCRPV